MGKFEAGEQSTEIQVLFCRWALSSNPHLFPYSKVRQEETFVNIFLFIFLFIYVHQKALHATFLSVLYLSANLYCWYINCITQAYGRATLSILLESYRNVILLFLLQTYYVLWNMFNICFASLRVYAYTI